MRSEPRCVIRHLAMSCYFCHSDSPRDFAYCSTLMLYEEHCRYLFIVSFVDHLAFALVYVSFFRSTFLKDRLSIFRCLRVQQNLISPVLYSPFWQLCISLRRISGFSPSYRAPGLSFMWRILFNIADMRWTTKTMSPSLGSRLYARVAACSIFRPVR